MQSVVALVTLLAIGMGLAHAGLWGALSGLVGALGTGSGIAILFGARGTDVSSSPSEKRAQRVGGVVAAALCLVGTFYGGWGWGWAWGLGGYIAGVLASLAFLSLLRQSDEVAGATAPAEIMPLVSIDEFTSRTRGGWPNRMSMSIYDGHPFQCACGKQHNYLIGETEVLRELPGMRLVFACPAGAAVTCVKVKGLLKFRGFQSLFGSLGS